MRWSRYSLRVQLSSDSTLLYNTFSGGLAQLDTETDNWISGAIAGNPVTPEQNEIIQELTDAMILRPDEADEDAEIRDWYASVKRGAEQINLTVLTTNACNMACSYCYEGEALRGTHIAAPVVERLLQWTAEKLAELQPRSILVRFFGGEPFVNPKGLLHLARELNSLCKSRGIPIELTATTNGTLLPRALIEELRDLGLKSLRITLDGDERLHNEKRPLKNGANSFQTIWENLENIRDLVRLDIAVNAEAKDDESFRKLLSQLNDSSFRSSINSVNVKPLQRFDPALKGIDSRLTPTIARSVTGWRKAVVKKGLKLRSLLDGGPCQIHRNANFVVDPKGDIYPCASAIGRTEAVIGSIFSSPKNPGSAAGRFFREYSPLDHPKCKTCSYFPICGGGCRLTSFALDPKVTTDFHCPGALFEAALPDEILRLFLAEQEGGDEIQEGEEVRA